MLRNLRLAVTSLAALFLILHGTTAQEASVPADERQKIENAAVEIGKTVIGQGHDADDVRKVLTFYVQSQVAQALDPLNPEAPLPASAEGEVEAIVEAAMKRLAAPPAPAPPQPTPPEPAPPDPLPPEPAPPQPDRPDEPNPPDPNPPEPGRNPGVVWVFVPFAPAPPAPFPADAPAQSFLSGPSFAPLPGPSPTIHIKHGWFGHPDKVWYSRHGSH